MIKVTQTTRDDFDPLYVLDLIQKRKMTKDEAIRILEEACHLIVRQRDDYNRMLRWYSYAPWKHDLEKK